MWEAIEGKKENKTGKKKIEDVKWNIHDDNWLDLESMHKVWKWVIWTNNYANNSCENKSNNDIDSFCTHLIYMTYRILTQNTSMQYEENAINPCVHKQRIKYMHGI